ncbi:non-canonical poly(A) polymerase PAP2 [Saccharomyces cerevisiae S288C]|uniref:Poly(A) RNA polymerase protein 2 n=2 Tax=Saccharomyces cerevisiae TaxID=4932 RepID=PAP2_YEAST|nr:non-canonical poly(A) polymerase PAP2 [Saccharomyces cerevisiae S288C]P53632.1 RecName: Full=Poly(A) RNA polymerase protein 2; AltName: Full=DNA polymerase kappa; AltName: Full=DNA polymerase sigma; AltName: Full=Topoisomerase 1-related protein TRF4 [Saccharomyces cerevisiae S288C]AAC49091.1 Trf4p [Saccharomyces cerevisiae]AJT77710.1 Pap2p [Saccharomyces cerevisiae YJM470]AJT87041.1 Pap2p [Saccharomyces cerevisiae YJM1083]AJT99682.1 Pap2p [Saccharomyces cerevisiae YJM1385]AJU08971.1 Pap2p |eukprot:NP_014526.1 non-canonical poly(A) polymerase PAP2 [Saccharomyces cerevisiae S288C]
MGAKSVTASSSKKIKNRHNGKVKKSKKIKKVRKPQKSISLNDENEVEILPSRNEQETNKLPKDHVTADGILVLEHKSDDDEGFDVYDGHFDNPTDIPSTTEESKTPSLAVHGDEKDLANNDDFISLSASSEDEQAEQEEEREKQELEIKKEKQKEILNTDYPWILNHDHSKQKEISDWLTFEIKDFVAYISPSREEIEIRNQTISTIREAVKQLWPDADLHVFGSYSTDLYLPGSDIDCVVTSELGGKESRNNLYSLASHLKKKNLATEVEVVAKARVPIIKFVEPHSGIHIDVSFERTNGIEAAKLIREWLDDTPGLRELVLIVKQFLHARRLNNVHTGGLGGFSIICLVFSFLHMHPRIITNEIDPKDNLGVLLIEFFELYGKNFGYDDVALGSSDGYPVYFPKSTWSAIQPIKNPFSLAIQDPGDESNNISRGSFNIRDIKKAFAGAFDLLTNRCFELHSATFKDRLGKSILGNVIKYRGKARDFKDERGLVLNKAIIENENYHKKRSRIIHDEDFAEDTVTSTATATTTDDDYEITNPPAKKAKIEEKPESEPAKRNSGETYITVSSEDDDEDGYNPYTL